MSQVRGQPRPARHGAAIVLLALLAPQGTLLLLRTHPSLDLVVRSATVHLVVVSAISACALAVAMATAVAAAQACHDEAAMCCQAPAGNLGRGWGV